MADWIKEYESFKNQEWKPTSLPKGEEVKFQNWLQQTKIFNSIKMEVAEENKIPVDAIDNKRLLNMMLKNSDYDYRGAFLAQVQESIDPFDGKPHMPDSANGKMLKSPKHPTAWKEFFMRTYDVNPDAIGLTQFEDAKEYTMKRTRLNQRQQQRNLISGEMQ
jgi:hypothetical protein